MDADDPVILCGHVFGILNSCQGGYGFGLVGIVEMAEATGFAG